MTALWTLVAVGLTLAGVVLQPDSATRALGAGLALAGVLAGIVAFTRIEREWPVPFPALRDREQVAGLRRWLGWLLFEAGLVLALWALWDVWRQPFAWGMAERWAAGLMMLAGAAYVLTGPLTPLPTAPDKPEATYLGHKLGVARVQNQGAGAAHSAISQRTPLSLTERLNLYYHPTPRLWLEVVLLVLIMSVAMWFRLHRIGEMPPGVFIDETNAALDALHVLEGRGDSLFGTGWFETPNGFVYWQTLFVRLFGASFAAVKLQSLLPGLLTVLALYLLAREMAGPYPALLAAVFLAFNRWHVTMSRWGWNEVYPPLILVLTLYFVMRAVRRRSLGDWAVAGVILGAGMYSYLAIRIVVVIVALYLCYRALVDRGFLRRSWQGILLFALLYVLTFAPLGFTYVKEPFTFLNRSKQVSIVRDVTEQGGLQPLAVSIKRHLQMFTVAGDRNPRHNLPGMPMLDPISGAFLLLGAGWALWRWRDHRRGLAVLWFGVALFGGIFSRLDEAPQAYRTLIVTPAIALLVADSYSLAWRALLLPGRRYVLWRRLVTLLLAGGVVVACWMNYRVFFEQQARSAAVYAAFSPLENAVAEDVLVSKEVADLYLSPRFYHFSPVQFFNYRPTHAVGFRLGPWAYSPFRALGGGLDAPGYAQIQPATDLPLPDKGQAAVLLLDLDYQYLMAYFRWFYPHAAGEVMRGRENEPLYFRVVIPAGDIAKAKDKLYSGGGLRGRYFRGDAWQGTPFIVRVDPFLMFAWPENAPLGGPFSVQWRGRLLAPAAGRYYFRLEADDGVRFWMDGKVATSALTPDQANLAEVTLPLTAGLHRIRIDYFQHGGAKSLSFYWQPPDEPLQPVGPEFLRVDEN